MKTTIRTATTVLPGRRVEVEVPELPEGTAVEVFVVSPDTASTGFASALDFLESLPVGPRAFRTWEEYERHLREERAAWDR